MLPRVGEGYTYDGKPPAPNLASHFHLALRATMSTYTGSGHRLHATMPIPPLRDSHVSSSPMYFIPTYHHTKTLYEIVHLGATWYLRIPNCVAAAQCIGTSFEYVVHETL